MWASDGSYWLGRKATGRTDIARLSPNDSVSYPLGHRLSDLFLNQILPGDRLALATRTLPVGTVYAVWTGLGTTGIVLIGMFWLNEPKDLPRFACLALIIVGVVGLRILEKSPK